MAVRKASVAKIIDTESLDDHVVEGEIIDDVTIGTVTVKMRRATDDQLVVLTRYARIAEKTQTIEAGNRAVEVFFDIIEDLLVDSNDVDRLVDAIIHRGATVKQITESMQTKKDDGEAPAPARTRRGR